MKATYVQDSDYLLSIYDFNYSPHEKPNTLKSTITGWTKKSKPIAVEKNTTITRLKKLYGSGLIINSSYNEGTSISFFIPRKEVNKNDKSFNNR